MALQVADLFYDRLFELDPLLEDTFDAELSEQGQRLVRAIGSLVAGLGDLDGTLSGARELGRRLAAYGVRPAHYTTFGAAWLWALEQSLADDFTRSVREAWTEICELLSSVMSEAAEEPESSVHRRSTAPVAFLRTAQ